MLGKIEGRRKGEDRGWDGWMASLTWWTWVWVNSGSWWWIGMLWFMGSQRVGHDWATELNWTDVNLDHLIKVVSVRFCHCKISNFHTLFFEGESLSPVTPKERWITFHFLEKQYLFEFLDFLCGPVVKNLLANAGDTGSIPGLASSHLLQLSLC